MYCQRQLFCFVAFLSACGQTRRMGRVRQGSSLTWLSIRIRLQGRKPEESNKLFDLLFSHKTRIRSIRSIRGKKNNPHALRCLEGTTLSNRGQRPRIHEHHHTSAWRAVRRRMSSHQCTSVVSHKTKTRKTPWKGWRAMPCCYAYALVL